MGKLTERRIAFKYWPDGWRAKKADVSILAKDPVFLHPADEVEVDTRRVADDLGEALKSVFPADDVISELLAGCRRVLWRRAGVAWSLLNFAHPDETYDDLDNLETLIAEPADFAEWLARFIAPEAVIFHETLDGNRPPALIRLLRDAVRASLSLEGRKPFIRLRTFKDQLNFNNESLTIVAIDDLPLPSGNEFRSKALQRFSRFQLLIDNVLGQRPTAASEPPVLRVAMLTQNAKLLDDEIENYRGLRTWQPLRIRREDVVSFSAEKDDVDSLGRAAIELFAKATRQVIEARKKP